MSLRARSAAALTSSTLPATALPASCAVLPRKSPTPLTAREGLAGGELGEVGEVVGGRSVGTPRVGQQRPGSVTGNGREREMRCQASGRQGLAQRMTACHASGPISAPPASHHPCCPCAPGSIADTGCGVCSLIGNVAARLVGGVINVLAQA